MVAINIVIGDRTYRIKIEPEHEEMVRRSVKTINDKIVEFRTQFAGKDMQDYISMVLVWFATSQSGDASSMQSNLDEYLTELEKNLDRGMPSHL